MKEKSTSRWGNALVYFVNKLWFLLASIIIIIALLFTLLRIFLPQIDYFKEDLEGWLSNEFQVDLAIGKIDAKWQANGPILALGELQVKSPQENFNLLSLDNIQVKIDGLASLLNWQLVTEEIDIAGAKLNFIIDRKLGVRFNSVTSSNDKTTAPEVQQTSQLIITHLFNQKNLLLTDSSITLQTLAGKQFNYEIEELNIDNFDDIHQLTGKLRDDFGGKLRLVAEIYGDPSLDNSHTNLYLEATEIDISDLPLYEKESDLKPVSGQLNWRLWANWKDGRWDFANGKMKVEKLAWRKKTEKQVVNSAENESYELNFQWQFLTKNEGLLSVNDAKLDSSSKTKFFPQIFVQFHQISDKDLRWDLSIYDWNAAPVAEKIVDIFELQTNPQTSTELPVQLDIEYMGIRLAKLNNQWQPPSLFAEYSNLNLSKDLILPTIDGVSGRISYADNFGIAEVKGKSVNIDIKDLFRTPLNFDSVDAKIEWLPDENDETEIHFQKVYLENQDLKFNAKGRFYQQESMPSIAIQAQLEDINVAYKSRYLPVGIMSEDLTRYLDESIIDGNISWVNAVIQGPLKSFPFDNPEGVFAIHANLNQAKYRYLPEWPEINNLQALLRFEGNGMHITGLSGQTQKIQMKFAEAVIKDFSLINTPLELSFDAISQGNLGRDFLKNTPINHIEQSLKEMNYSGEIRTHVSFKVGLDENNLFDLMGQVIPKRKKSHLAFYGFQVENLSGILNFDEDGVSESNLTASYFGEKIKAHLYRGGVSKKVLTSGPSELSIDVSGRINERAIKDYLGKEFSNFFSGVSPFKTSIHIAPKHLAEKVYVDVDLSMEGMEVSLPGVLSKPKKLKKTLDLHFDLADKSSISISWDKFKAKWWWLNKNEETIHDGGVVLYDSEYRLSDISPKKIVADLNFSSLDLNSWTDFIQTNQSSIIEKPTQNMPEVEISVKIKELMNDYFELNELNVNFRKIQDHTGDKWMTSLMSPQGNFELLSKSDNPWQLKISNLNLRPKNNKANSHIVDENINDKILKNKVTKRNFLNRQMFKTFWNDTDEQFFELNLLCSNCQFDEKMLGNIQANIKKTPEGFFAGGLIKHQNAHQLNFDAKWIFSDEVSEVFVENKQLNMSEHSEVAEKKEGEKLLDKQSALSDFTVISFDLESDNIGELLARWDYVVGISDSDGNINGRLWWQGNPSDFSPEMMEGDARLDFSQGYLQDVSDAKARLFSLFSLQSLSRRLRLDFKDVYKKGFFYEQLTGDVQMRDGTLVSDNIYVDGSAAKVELSGSVDLNNKVIEQRALVTPQLTSSLPVLIGWAVEPTTGILVYLLNKMFEPAIEVVTQIEYRIHGSLESIEISEIKKSKSKVKYKTETLPEADETLESKEILESKETIELKELKNLESELSEYEKNNLSSNKKLEQLASENEN